MALELVGGALLSVFLDAAFQKLSSPEILDFFRARKLDHKLLSKLETKLNSINSLADDAEGKQFTDPHVRNWLLKVKDAVFDAEDLLDDIQMLSKREVDAESESQTSTGCTCKVLNFFKSSRISSLNKEIESRMEQNLNDLEFLSSQKGALGLKKASGVRSRLSTELPQKSQTTSLVVGTDIYGRDDDKELIFDWLISDDDNNNSPDQLSILSIVGMGGVGKTTLAQHVFNDPRLDEAKFDIKRWVCVSDEFDVFKVSRAILEAFTVSTDDSRDLEMVHTRLKGQLTEKKFFLVLDDVWNENRSKWEEVQKSLVFGAKGSRILVTTRSKEVASTMGSKDYSLKQLQEYDCWKLFAKHAFRDDDTQPNPECREIGMKIVEKCKGLPLALKTMGSLLYKKSSISEWKSVFQSEIWEFSKDRCDIVPALALSYIHLSSPLKVCFAYCALFPKDYPFKKKDLFQLWMIENFVHCSQHSMTPEDVCEQYFNDLLSRSFFQQSDEKEEVFLMHDLLHDLAKYVGGGIYFMWEVGKTEKIQKVTRHFSVKLGYNQYFDGFGKLCSTEKLRTFMPTSGLHINMSIHELFSKFKLLRMLSLSCVLNFELLPDSVGNLEHLRSLNLSNTAIKKLTEKICSLTHLQILKLNYCSDLEELPSNLYLLTNLYRLEFIKTKVRKVPPHLGKLKNLKVVMDFKVGHGREFGIQQLGELNLEGSLSIKKLQNIENSQDALEADLKNKTHLEKLQLRWDSMRNKNSIDSKKEEDIIEKLQPSNYLKELSIFNYGGKRFPNGLLDNSLPNLVSLELRGCESCQRLPPLGLLPFLKKLVIAEFDEIVSIDADFHGNNSSSFTSLQNLEFSYMKQWEKWECKAVTGAFPCLQHLSISFCPNLKGQLPEQLVPLETLEITNCQELEASAPRALYLELRYCGKLQLDWAIMKKLRMNASLPKIFGSDTLEDLDIYSPQESISDDCVSLRTFPLDFFPILRYLSLSGFDNLQMISQDHSHHHLKVLSISECPKFESLPANMHMLLPSLRSLYIKHCPRLEFPDGGFPSSMEDMGISECSKFESLPRNMHMLLPSLKILHIEDCPRLESFPNGGLPSNLEDLTIKECPKFESLPENMHMLLPSLTELRIEDCPRFESFPDGRLPLNLKYMTLTHCYKLIGSLKGALGDNPCLENLCIRKLDVECFPEEGLLPDSLTDLYIRDCLNLEKLDYKGCCQLSSLKTLSLDNCPDLQCLPEEGLPKSISDLYICDCPLLYERCEEGGEDWEKISHLPYLNIESIDL